MVSLSNHGAGRPLSTILRQAQDDTSRTFSWLKHRYKIRYRSRMTNESDFITKTRLCKQAISFLQACGTSPSP
jgi:hypothetical protein